MIRLLIGVRWLRGVAVAMKNDGMKVCSSCRRPLTLRFRDFEGVGFWFHWVGNYYCVDAVLFVEGYRIRLFSEVWVLGEEHEQERMRRGL